MFRFTSKLLILQLSSTPLCNIIISSILLLILSHSVETTHNDISYAIDPTLPDRVYLGSMVHFDDVGILLYDFPDYALPVMVAKAPQFPTPAPYPAPAPAPAQVDFSVSHSNGGGALPVQASPA